MIFNPNIKHKSVTFALSNPTEKSIEANHPVS